MLFFGSILEEDTKLPISCFYLVRNRTGITSFCQYVLVLVPVQIQYILNNVLFYKDHDEPHLKGIKKANLFKGVMRCALIV